MVRNDEYVTDPLSEDDLPAGIRQHLSDEANFRRESIEIPPDEFAATRDDPEFDHHFVGCAVRNADGDVLLVRHDDPERAGWVLPGGAVDPEESLDTAVRQAVEQDTGVACDVDAVIQVIEQEFRHAGDNSKSVTGYFVLFAATVGADRADELVDGTESIAAVEWFESVPRETPQPYLIQDVLTSE